MFPFFIRTDQHDQLLSLCDVQGREISGAPFMPTFQEFIDLLRVARDTGYLVINGCRYSVARIDENPPASLYFLMPESDQQREWGRNRHSILRVLQKTNQTFESCRNLEDFAYQTVVCARRYLNLDRVSFWLFDPQEQEIRGGWGTDQDGNLREEKDIIFKADQVSWYADAVAEKSGLTVYEDADLFDYFDVVGKGTQVICTIRYSDQLVGWLVCDNLLHGCYYSESDRILISLYGQIIGQWFARFEAENRWKELKETLEHMVEDKTAELKDIIRRLAKMQQNLIDTEKAKTLSNFTAGIAHEINNPIGFIRSNLSFIGKVSSQVLQSLDNGQSMDKSVELLKEVDEVIDESVQGLDRVSHIISLLQPLNNLSEEEPQVFDIDQSIEFIILSMEQESDCIHVHSSFKPISVELPLQVFTLALENVLTNALESVSERENPSVDVSASVDDEHLVVLVRDNGKGISAANIRSIFDPFFTTKAVGEGVGLGLSLSENLLKMVNGRLEVESQEGKGTSMKIVFPKEVIRNA